MTAKDDLIELRRLLARMTIEQKLELLAAVKQEARSLAPLWPLPGTCADHPKPSCQ